MYDSHDNVYYKFGMVKPDPKQALEQRQIVTKFAVGPLNSMISIADLERAIAGESIVKRHYDGQTYTGRNDVELYVGTGPAQWTVDELKEIIEIEKARPVQKRVSSENVDIEGMKAVIARQQEAIEALSKKLDGQEKRGPGRPKKDASE